MVSFTRFQAHLDQLGLTQVDAAQLLSVDPRTVRRWAENSTEIPGPVEQVLLAWVNLHRRGLAWRPDSEAIAADDIEAFARFREHAIDLDAVLRRVEARGGPAAPWQVNLQRCTATLGPLHVSFYKLRNGGFSPQSYRRSDGPVDMKRDWTLIEDAFACIARAFGDEGSMHSTHFAFLGHPALNDGRLTFWDVSLSPPVVAAISCDALRMIAGQSRKLSDEDCRVLVVGHGNKELITGVAEALFAAGKYSEREMGIRVVDIGEHDLQSIASRLSWDILEMRPIWGGI